MAVYSTDDTGNIYRRCGYCGAEARHFDLTEGIPVGEFRQEVSIEDGEPVIRWLPRIKQHEVCGSCLKLFIQLQRGCEMIRRDFEIARSPFLNRDWLKYPPVDEGRIAEEIKKMRRKLLTRAVNKLGVKPEEI